MIDSGALLRAPSKAGAEHLRIRVTTANVRKADADDGEDAWAFRSQACCRALREQAPDCLGLQEVRRRQLQDLQDGLPDYDWFGMPRSPVDGHPVNAIAWRRQRFALLGSGGYWLSATPHIPASRSWGTASIRLANWVWLEDRQTGLRLRHINTHLDHVSEQARRNGARLIVEDAAAWPVQLPQILTADANARSQDPELVALRQSGWHDSWQETGRAEPRTTFHGFAGDASDERRGRIDLVWHRGGLEAIEAQCLTEADPDSGRWPSDHYFISVDLRLRSVAGGQPPGSDRS